MKSVVVTGVSSGIGYYATRTLIDGYSRERLGSLIHKALTTERPRVRYAAVNSSIAGKLMLALAPKRFIDRVIGMAVGLLPKK